MTCYCQEGVPLVVSVTEWRTAKREHLCCECREPIKPGERYEHVRGLSNDDWRWLSFKTCYECVDTRELVYDMAGFIPAFGEAACCFVEAMREASR